MLSALVRISKAELRSQWAHSHSSLGLMHPSHTGPQILVSLEINGDHCSGKTTGPPRKGQVGKLTPRRGVRLVRGTQVGYVGLDIELHALLCSSTALDLCDLSGPDSGTAFQLESSAVASIDADSEKDGLATANQNHSWARHGSDGLPGVG